LKELRIPRKYFSYKKKNMDPFVNLPLEIIQQIAFKLPLAEILRNCSVSQSFNQELCQDDYFWRMIYQTRIGDTSKVTIAPGDSWREKVLEKLLPPLYKLGRLLDKKGARGVSLYQLRVDTRNLEAILRFEVDPNDYPQKVREFWFLGSLDRRRLRLQPEEPIYLYLLDGDDVRKMTLFYKNLQGTY
jgi:hypothetical protein